MAVQFDGGVVIGADSRTTTGRWGRAEEDRVARAELIVFFLSATWRTEPATS